MFMILGKDSGNDDSNSSSIHPRVVPPWLPSHCLGGKAFHHLVVQDGALYLHEFAVHTDEANHHHARHRQKTHAVDANLPDGSNTQLSCNHGLLGFTLG